MLENVDSHYDDLSKAHHSIIEQLATEDDDGFNEQDGERRAIDKVFYDIKAIIKFSLFVVVEVSAATTQVIDATTRLSLKLPVINYRIFRGDLNSGLKLQGFSSHFTFKRH